MRSVCSCPAAAMVQYDDVTCVTAQRDRERFAAPGVEISFCGSDRELGVQLTAARPLARIVLCWMAHFPMETLFLADHWERSYGDLQWRSLQPERILPWYFAAHDPASRRSWAVGVKTQPNTLCFFTVDAQGISLWLDCRNGGGPVALGARQLHAATIVAAESQVDETPFTLLRRFCRQMSPEPRLPAAPVAGNNNWYYAYGKNFDAAAILRDAHFLADLAGTHANRPFCVIDAGWNPGGDAPGGPWTAGWPDRFPDMPGLAGQIKALKVRPGIWIRPSALTTVDNPGRLRMGPNLGVPEKPLDFTLADNLAILHEDIRRIHTWGYELLKHDFSTWDAFGRWGFEMGAELTSGNWHWHDRSLTNAEVLLRWYRAIRAAAGDAYVLGCNTIGHLGAGLFELQRTGDDTSGIHWERTRRMGPNTLAFRLPQHNSFFMLDADCTPHTPATPWEKNRQWLDLVARSGTALFISADPTGIPTEIRAGFGTAIQLALNGGVPGGVEPLDWLQTTAPERWRSGVETVHYDWSEAYGAFPLRV